MNRRAMSTGDMPERGTKGVDAAMFKNILVGSVSQKVSHLANCTCITVK